MQNFNQILQNFDEISPEFHPYSPKVLRRNTRPTCAERCRKACAPSGDAAARVRGFFKDETHGRRVLGGAARPARLLETLPLESVDFQRRNIRPTCAERWRKTYAPSWGAAARVRGLFKDETHGRRVQGGAASRVVFRNSGGILHAPNLPSFS